MEEQRIDCASIVHELNNALENGSFKPTATDLVLIGIFAALQEQNEALRENAKLQKTGYFNKIAKSN